MEPSPHTPQSTNTVFGSDYIKYITKIVPNAEKNENNSVILLKEKTDVERFNKLTESFFKDGYGIKGQIVVNKKGSTNDKTIQSIVAKLSDEKSLYLSINKKDGLVAKTTYLGMELEVNKIDLKTLLTKFLPVFGEIQIFISKIKVPIKKKVQYAVFSSDFELGVDFKGVKSVEFTFDNNKSRKTIFYKEGFLNKQNLEKKIGYSPVHKAEIPVQTELLTKKFIYFSKNEETDKFFRNNIQKLCKDFEENHNEFKFSFDDPTFAPVFKNMLVSYDSFKDTLSYVEQSNEGCSVRAIGFPENYDEKAILYLVDKISRNIDVHIRFFYPDESEGWLEERKVFIYFPNPVDAENLMTHSQYFQFDNIIVQFILADDEYDENSRAKYSYLIPKEKIGRFSKLKECMSNKLIIAYDYGKYINTEFREPPKEEFNMKYPLKQQPQTMKLRGFPDTTPLPVLYKLFEKYGVINIQPRMKDDEFNFTLEVATLDDSEDLMKLFSKNVEMDTSDEIKSDKNRNSNHEE